MSRLARRLPAPLLELALAARDKLRCARAGVPPSPFGTDGVGYESLVQVIRELRLLERPGDLLEIGALLGGGSLKLSRLLERDAPAKKLYVIDAFAHDWRRETDGVDNLYLPGLKRRYGGLSQREVFDRVTAGRTNIVVLAGDSRRVALPAEKLCFAFIDGDHAPASVASDFALAWTRLSPGGAVALHDYRYLYPETTAAIDSLAEKRAAEIAERREDARKHVLWLVKAGR